MVNKVLVRKLEKLDNISRNRWFKDFPESFPEARWNGDLQRQERLLIKDIDSNYSQKEIRKAVNQCNCKTYYISSNCHTGKVGLDCNDTPQGGGIIAQTDSFEETEKIAFEMYGINKYFIH